MKKKFKRSVASRSISYKHFQFATLSTCKTRNEQTLPRSQATQTLLATRRDSTGQSSGLEQNAGFSSISTIQRLSLGSAIKLKKYVGPVPAYYAAVRLQLRNQNPSASGGFRLRPSRPRPSTRSTGPPTDH